MLAYLFVLLAIADRVFLATGSHAGHPWWNFTAVGGSLLFFGAQKPLRQAWIPVVALSLTDILLTRYAYHFPFDWTSVPSWAWYGLAILLGSVILRRGASAATVVGASVASATLFFFISNTLFFVISNFSGIYPVSIYSHSWAGLLQCYAAGLPFYRNDLVSTVVTLAAAYGVLTLVRGRAEGQPAVDHFAA